MTRLTIEEYVAEYEFRGEVDYKPTLDEQALLLDALHGWEAAKEDAGRAALEQGGQS